MSRQKSRVFATRCVVLGGDGLGRPAEHVVNAEPARLLLSYSGFGCAYDSVDIECHPRLTCTMNVVELQQRHGGIAWRLYDERFHCVRAMAPQLPWDVAMWLIHSCPLGRQVAPHEQVPFRQGAAPSPFRATQRQCVDYNYRGTRVFPVGPCITCWQVPRQASRRRCAPTA